MIKRLLLFSVLALGAFNLNAETLTKVTVEQASASTDYTMYSTGKMYFSGSQLVIDTVGNGNVAKFGLNTINKLLFSTFEYTSAGEVRILNDASSLSVAPTLATDYICVNASTEKFNYQILSIAGGTVMKGQAANGEQINVGNLAKGTYLICINGSILKFNKK